MSLTLSSKGWVVIPAELRKKYNLKPGTEVQIVDYGGVLALVPLLKNPVRQTAGLVPRTKNRKPLTEVLLDEHRQELEHE